MGDILSTRPGRRLGAGTGSRHAAPPVLLAACAVLAAVVPAQQPVLPSAYATADATGGTNVPFGRGTPIRLQAAYESLLFSGPVVLQGLGLRADANSQASSKQVDLEVRLSTMPWSVTALQHRFSSNPGADETVVVERRLVVLPAFTSGALGSFAVSLPFDHTFAYDPSRGSLLVDVRVYAQDPGAYPLDATFLCDSPRQTIGPAGCGAGALPLEVDVPTRQVVWGRAVYFELQNATPQSITGLLLGTQDQGLWNGVPLPIDLAPLGASGCHLSIDVQWMTASPASAAGTVSTSLNIPSIPTLQGGWIRYQGYSFDTANNALGVVTSQAAKVQICGWDPVARVWAPDLSTPIGTREIGIAPVLQLTVQ